MMKSKSSFIFKLLSKSHKIDLSHAHNLHEITEAVNATIKYVNDYEEKNNKLRDKVKNRELFYDHFADQSSANKWENNYKLKKINLNLLPKFLIENKNNYKEWFDN